MICSSQVQCDPLHLSNHLATHSLSLPAYTDMLGPGEDQESSEVVSTNSSTSKSSPGLLDTTRKSVEEEDDDDESEDEMMEMPEPQVEIEEEPDSELLQIENDHHQEDNGELVENMFR